MPYFFRFLKGFMACLLFVPVTFAQTTLPVVRDNQVIDVSSTNNNPQHPSIMAKRSPNSSTNPIQRGFFDFDWTCLPESLQVDSAPLFLFHALSTAGNTHQGANVCVLQRVTASWDENTINWSNQPATTTTNQVVVPQQPANADLSILITPLVQDILNQPANNRHGLLFKLQSETGWQRQVYASSNYSDPALHPYMILYASSNPVTSVNVTACDSYLSPGGQTLTTSGTYQETLTTSAGCDSLIEINLQVNQVDAGISQQGTSLLANVTGPGRTYQWLNCGFGYQPETGETNAVLNPSSSGSYSVEVTENGCVDTSICIFTFATGQESPQDNFALQVFPNPTSNNITIDLGQVSKAVTIVVHNLLGEEVLSQTFQNTNRMEVQLPNAAGIYLVQISTTEGQSEVVRVVKSE